MIYDYDNFISSGYLTFDGQITEVGAMSDFVFEGSEIIDAKGKLVLPSFVSGHTHIYSQFARGLAIPFQPRNFQEILDQLWWRLDREIDNQTTYYSAITCGIDNLRSGVTTLIDHHASGQEIAGSLEEIRKALADVIGMRGVLCFETSDRFDVDGCIAENERMIEKTKSPYSAGMFGLHASLSLSDASLNKVKASLNGAPVHIHVAESQMDQDDCLRKYGVRIVNRLDGFGLITADSLLVHCVHVDDEELDIIKQRKAVIAINPSSNLNNGVGLPDFRRFKEKGIPVILGNDGLDQGMAQEYRNLVFTQHHQNQTPTDFGLSDLKSILDETYRFASRRLGAKLGRLIPGYEADFVIHPYQAPTPLAKDNLLGHLVYGLYSRFQPSDVFVGGKHLIANYGIDPSLARIYQEAAIVAERLWSRL